MIYKELCKSFGKVPIDHMSFQEALAKEMCDDWWVRQGSLSQWNLSRPNLHMLVKNNKRRQCMYCGKNPRARHECAACVGVQLHEGECYYKTHYPLRR